MPESRETKEQEQSSKESLWPEKKYHRQLEKLRKMLNQPVYIVPLNLTEKYLTFSISGSPKTLIDIIDYPSPDPENHLYPHMLIFDDGTGINIGRILKISSQSPFSSDKDALLYEDTELQKSLMYKPRQLSQETIRQTSRAMLSAILSKAPEPENTLPDDKKNQPLKKL